MFEEGGEGEEDIIELGKVYSSVSSEDTQATRVALPAALHFVVY